PARAQELERAHRGLYRRPRLTVAPRTEHVDAGSDLDLDQAFHLQRDQRLAHRRPRHTELSRKIAFRRQPRAGRELPGADQSANLVGDLTVEPAGFDDVDRHRPKKAVARDIAGAVLLLIS